MKIQQYDKSSQKHENTRWVVDGRHWGVFFMTSDSQNVPMTVQRMKNGRATSQVKPYRSRDAVDF
jgi:FixJ family two-component response regulator